MKRSPAVAGQFYPASRSEIDDSLGELLSPAPRPIEAVGILVPHAGWMYSGAVAGKVYGSVRLPQRHVILCPNHTGRGAPLAINTRGSWTTPLGDAPVDEELAAAILQRFPEVSDDAEAHAAEHSLEVQLPFLQRLVDGFRFVPVCVMTHDLPTLLALGEAIAGAVRDCPDDVLLVVSSDMTHYEPAETARRKDQRAIARLEAMDAEGLHATVHREGISMCGVAPAVAGLAASRRLGAGEARLLCYANSGDVSGDFDQVVGYAGMVLGPGAA